MSITQEQLESLEQSFTKTEEAPVAEEPAKEVVQEEVEPTEAVAEETVEVAEEPQETVEEPTEEVAAEPEQPSDNILSLGEETETPSEPTEDLNALKDQIKALTNENEKLRSTPKLDPRLEKMAKWIENGGEVNAAFWELQSKDYNTLDVRQPKDGLSALKDKMKYIENMDSDEIEFYLEKNYPILTGKIEEDDIEEEGDKRAEEMKLRMEARQALPELAKYQKEVSLPQVDHKAQEERDNQLNIYRAEASTKTDEIESFEIALPDVTLKLPFQGEGKKFAKSIVTEPENQAKFWVDRYSDENGNLNYHLWNEELYFLQNRSRILNAIYAQGKSAGKKEVIQETQGDNITPKINKPIKKARESYGGLENMSFTKPSRR